MAGGTWSTSSPPVRAGAYFNFLAALQAAATAGIGGTCAVIGTADWGPIGEVTPITSSGGFEQKFGRNNVGTLRDAVFAALDGFDEGGASTVLAYRAAVPAAAFAAVTINDATIPWLVVTAKYKGARGNNFTVVIQTNAIDATKKDLILYESGIELERFTGITNTNTAFADFITAQASQNITAAITGTGARAGVNVASTPLVSGNSGTAITGTEVTAAQGIFREQYFDSIVLADVADETILDAFATYIDVDLNLRGKRCFGVIGGLAAETFAEAKSRSILATGGDVGADSYNVVNIGATDVKRLSDGVILPTSKVAARLAGAIAGTGFRRALTNLRWTGYQVVTPLSDAQYTDAINTGIVTFSNDAIDRVVIEMGVTTLNTVNLTDRPSVNKKIRNVAVQHFIEKTLNRVARDDYLGTLVNTDTGQKDLAVSFLQFLKSLEDRGALKARQSTVELDTQFDNSGNAVYLKYSIVHAETVERIFSTVRVR